MTSIVPLLGCACPASEGQSYPAFRSIMRCLKNSTPSLPFNCHATRHARNVRAASKVNSISLGIVSQLSTCRHAPSPLKSSTMQLINVWSRAPKIIFAGLTFWYAEVCAGLAAFVLASMRSKIDLSRCQFLQKPWRFSSNSIDFIYHACGPHARPGEHPTSIEKGDWVYNKILTF